MNQPSPQAVSTAAQSTPGTCARCGKTLAENDRVEASDRSFCRACFETLRAELAQAIEATSKDVNYPLALVGALLGGTLGVLVWWGFTALTKISFGLVAVAIGFLVGQGAVRFAGHKRSRGLQALSTVVALLSFLVASYLVNMTFINQQLAASGDDRRVAFPPAGIDQLIAVVGAGFGVMDLVFIAIVVWQAWSIPRPLSLPNAPAS